MQDNEQHYESNTLASTLITKIGNDNLAYILWFCASMLWIIGFIFPNQNDINIVSSNLCRSLGLLIFNGLLLYGPTLVGCKNKQQQKKYMSYKSLKYLSLRHLLLGSYSFVFSLSHFYLPPPIVYTIFFSGPLFVLSLQYLIHKSKITQQQLKGAIMATIGVLLTANGIILTDWLFSSGVNIEDQEFQTTFQNYKTTNPYIKSLAALILIIMQLAWSYAVVIVRNIQRLTHYQANMNFGVILTIMVGVIYQFTEERAFTSDNIILYFKCILFEGIVLALSQACFMEALLLTKNRGIITMIGFTGVVFSYFLSIFRYSESVNAICLIGVVLVIFGIYKIVIKKEQS